MEDYSTKAKPEINKQIVQMWKHLDFFMFILK